MTIQEMIREYGVCTVLEKCETVLRDENYNSVADDLASVIYRYTNEEPDEDEGDDLCDVCMRSGVSVSHTDEVGRTVCNDCLGGDNRG